MTPDYARKIIYDNVGKVDLFALRPMIGDEYWDLVLSTCICKICGKTLGAHYGWKCINGLPTVFSVDPVFIKICKEILANR